MSNSKTSGLELPEPRPLYLQIQEKLIERLITGEWGPGDLLPSEMRLAAEYGVHQGTVRKALDAMVTRNLVIRHQGKGTFVSTVAMRHSPFQYFRLFSRIRPYERPTSQFVSIDLDKATDRDRHKLNLPANSNVVRTVKLRTFGSVPAILERIAYPAEMFPGLDLLFRRLEPDTTYGLLEQKYRVLIAKVSEKLRPSAADIVDAELLPVSVGDPLLEIDRVAFSVDGSAAEWRVSRCTDYCEYIAGND